MKASWKKITVSSFVICLFGWIAAGLCVGQTDKDSQQYEKLERELRKDLDKEIAKFKPPTNAIQTKPSLTEPRPLSVGLSYDKFKDVTTAVISTPVQDLRGIVNAGLKNYIAFVDVYATYSYPGQQPVKPTIINLLFKTYADGPFFGFDPSLIAIANNKRIRLGNMSQTVKRATTSGVDEFVAVPIPYEVFAEIASADVVEVQIGNIDFPLSALNLRGFRMIAGLPDKPQQQVVPNSEGEKSTLITSNETPRRIEKTSWQGEDELSVAFQADGTLILQGGGLGNRSGVWRQEGDRVQIELTSIGAGWGSRLIAVGIIRVDKMGIMFKARGGIYSGTTKAVIQQILP